MTAASSPDPRPTRHPDEARLGRRAAISLAALLVAALTTIGVVLANSIHQQDENRVTAQLTAVVQAALREASHEADEAQQRAAALAEDPQLQRALEGGDARAIARLTRTVPGASAAPAGQPIPRPSEPSLRREVRVLAHGKLVGTVTVAVPLGRAMLARLRAAAGLTAGEGLLFVRGGHVVAGPATLWGARIPPHAQSVRLSGAGYRVVQARFVGGARPVELAALAPAAEVTGPFARSERLLAASLAVTFVALLLLARMLAQLALVSPLTRLARDARSSGTDELTSLPNRRAFAEAAAAELVRSRRTGRPLAVALIDLDDFKQVNDTFGHSTGDRTLCEVADVLRSEFRGIDLPARFGGEEFAVLLPETDLTGAGEAVERFVSALAGKEFGDGRTRPYRITASAGVAAAADLDVQQLLEVADGALYRAKAQGKNQVSVAPPEPSRRLDHRSGSTS